MTPTICSEPGCKVQEAVTGQMRLYDGKPYCRPHYEAKLNKNLQHEFRKWDKDSLPPPRFLSLLGRTSDDFKWKNIGDSYLTPARIRDRGFVFVKTDTGCTFKIVRHPNAQKLGYVTKRVTESWEADIFNQQLKLIDTRAFQEGDLDK